MKLKEEIAQIKKAIGRVPCYPSIDSKMRRLHDSCTRIDEKLNLLIDYLELEIKPQDRTRYKIVKKQKE